MKKAILMILFAMPLAAVAQSDHTDTGLWLSAEAVKKINKQWSLYGGAEYRLQDNFSASDRWNLELGARFKPYKWLKLDAGYKFMRDYNLEETKYKSNGVTPNKVIPAYWDTRHRFYASATGSVKAGDLTFSLRERWQYTYRPSLTVDRYDVDDDEWETKEVRGKASHVLRSRVETAYAIPHSAVEPYVSAELYNTTGGIDKIRYTLGADFRLSKQHSLGAFYRYIDEKDDVNKHVIGLGYKYKF